MSRRLLSVALSKDARLDVLLGIVPCPSSVAHAYCALNTRNKCPCQEPCNTVLAEAGTCQQRREDDESSRSYHFPKRCLSGDPDASLVLWRHAFVDNFGELLHALLHHVICSPPNRFHCHCTEEVWQHCAH